jgi:hypothetical protein
MKARKDNDMTVRQVSDVFSRSAVLDVREEIAAVNPEAVIAEGLDEALIGYTVCGEESVAVYNSDKCVSILAEKHGMTEEDAEDYFSYNVLGSLINYGENAPVFVKIPD